MKNEIFMKCFYGNISYILLLTHGALCCGNLIVYDIGIDDIALKAYYITINFKLHALKGIEVKGCDKIKELTKLNHHQCGWKNVID